MLEDLIQESWNISTFYVKRSAQQFNVQGDEFEDNPMVELAYEAADLFENGPIELVQSKNWLTRLDNLLDQTSAMEAYNQYDLIRKNRYKK